MSGSTDVTADLTQKIASLLDSDKGTFSIGGSILIAPPHETTTGAAASERTKSAPITLRWDPSSAPAGESRNIMFPPTSTHSMEQLETLLRDCQPASFGRGGQDVFDEAYRKASKLDASKFSSDLCPYELGVVDTVAELLMPSAYIAGGSRGVVAELYKLNVYSAPTGHFKPHVDTPRSEQQFGSLVICLPTVHTGGALEVRHAGQKVTYDWGANTGLNDGDAAVGRPTLLQWAAFYSDCEHEVFEVTAGHRVTLTYNLYAAPRRVEVEGKTESMDISRLPLYSAVREAVTNPLFMPNGGLLGFYCCHSYPHSTKSPAGAPLFPSVLKGVDLCLYSVLQELGLEVQVRPVLNATRDPYDYDSDNSEDGGATDTKWYVGDESKGLVTTDTGGYDGASWKDIWSGFGNQLDVHWLNTPTAKPTQEGYVHLTYGNEAGINSIYTYITLIVQLKREKASKKNVGMWFKPSRGDAGSIRTSEQPNPASNNTLSTIPSNDQDLEIPDGGYGWVQVFGIFLINAFTWGQTASYGVYLAFYLSANLFPEATSIDYAFIGGFQFAFPLLVAPVATIASRQLGMRICMLAGIFLQTLGFISASFAHRIWQLYLTQGILVGIGLGFIFVPATPILSQWFSRKRSLATGIGAGGSGIGGLIFSFGITPIVHNISLAWAFRTTAFICGAMNLLAVALLRNRNDKIKPPQLGFDTKLLVRYDVWLFLAWGFVTMFGYMTLLYSLSDFASSIGLSKTQAGNISAFLNLGTAIGRPAVGLISDKFGRIEVAGSLTLLGGLASFAIWIPAKTYAVTIFFSILVGTIFGLFWMTVAPIAVNVVGVPEVPSMLSIYWIVITAPTLCTEVIALKLRRPSMNNVYLYPQIFTGISYSLASIFLLELWRVMRKKGKGHRSISVPSETIRQSGQGSVSVTVTTQPAGMVVLTDIEKID
ncbi:hypothetical protein B7463_g10442, partial [Scytalidium lignicola]